MGTDLQRFKDLLRDFGIEFKEHRIANTVSIYTGPGIGDEKTCALFAFKDNGDFVEHGTYC